MSHFIALTCEAMLRSVTAAAASSPHRVTIQTFKQGLHDRPKSLNGALQAAVDSVTIGQGACDAVLLAYGLCGTATVGLTARQVPLVMPRAHDCITLYLGSKERYQAEIEAQRGTYWFSVDYLERAEPGSTIALGAAGLADEAAQYEKWAAKWDVETADMLLAELRKWSRHYTRAVFIDTDSPDIDEATRAKYAEVARQKAAQEGWQFERKQGSRRLLNMLVNGDWPEAEFLVVKPGQAIAQSYADDVLRADEAHTEDGLSV
jgi:hypothetical protein